MFFIIYIALAVSPTCLFARDFDCSRTHPTIRGKPNGTISSNTDNTGLGLTREFNHCWKVIVSPNKFVRFRFIKLNFEFCEANCRFCHFVEFFNDQNLSLPILFRQCTRSPPPYAFTSTANEAWVMFHIAKPFDVGVRFFEVQFDEVDQKQNDEDFEKCSETAEITYVSQPGTVHSYVTASGKYRPSDKCIWRLRATGNVAFRLSFKIMDIEGLCTAWDKYCRKEKCVDYVKTTIEMKNSKTIYRCGHYATRDFYEISIPSNVVEITFATYSKATSRGFIMDYELVNPDNINCWRPMDARHLDRLNWQSLEVFVNPDESVDDVSYRRQSDGHHRLSQNCMFRYKTDSQFVFKIVFTYVDLQSESTVSVVCNSGPSVISLTGQALLIGDKPRVVICQSKKMSVDLITGRRRPRIGYNATITSVFKSDYSPCNPVPDIELSEHGHESGMISNDRRRDGRYKMQSDCTWKIIAVEEQKVIRLNITELDIDVCETDWVVVYDGLTTDSPKLTQKLCGTTPPEDALVATSGTVLVHFFTNNLDDNQGSGFTIGFRLEDAEPTETDDNSELRNVIISVSVVGFVVILVAILTTVVIYRRKVEFERKKKKILDNMLIEAYRIKIDDFQSLLHEFGCLELTEMVRKLTVSLDRIEMLSEHIGRGHFGDVTKAILTDSNGVDRSAVALKCLSIGGLVGGTKKLQDEAIRGLLREGFIMQKLDHPNVLPLLGIVIFNQSPHLILPFMENRSLYEFLRKQAKKNETQQLPLVNFCKQICSGMAYLHENNFIHCDLACRNVLVSSELDLKVSDFGFAKARKKENEAFDTIEEFGDDEEAIPIPIRWQPPESFNIPRIFTQKTDIWAFGVVCWEIFTLCETLPYHQLAAHDVMDSVCNGLRLQRPERCPFEMYNKILNECWRVERQFRPDFTTLDQLLSQF